MKTGSWLWMLDGRDLKKSPTSVRGRAQGDGAPWAEENEGWRRRREEEEAEEKKKKNDAATSSVANQNLAFRR